MRTQARKKPGNKAIKSFKYFKIQTVYYISFFCKSERWKSNNRPEINWSAGLRAQDGMQVDEAR
jgi:hypothetical protein